VYVDSPGGDVREAMRIGRLIRKLLLTVEAPSYFDLAEADDPTKRASTKTYLWLFDAEQMKPICIGAPGSCGCASACTLIWVAGGKRDGDVLGLHRPRFKDQSFAALDAESAQRAYGGVISEMSQYLKDMEAPPEFALKMVETPSSEIMWNEPDRSESGSNDGYPPSIAEWLMANCGSYSREQKSHLWDLATKKNAGYVLTDAETREYAIDENAYSSVLGCHLRKLAQHRDSTSLN
jgi:hypothetical protein